MEKENIKETKFKNPLEATSYLLELGAEKISLEECRTYLLKFGLRPKEVENQVQYFADFYLLDGMVFTLDKECQSLYINGMPVDVQRKMEESSFKEDSYGEKHVFTLEVLVYLDSIINHGEKDFEDYYNEKLHKVKSSILEKYMNSVDKVKPIKSKLPYLEEFDAFSIRPLSCDKSEIEKYEDVFLDKASFHTTGLYKSKKDSLIDDSITFEYVTETFHSVYRITPNFMSTTVINYCYDDKEKYEQIYHFNNNDKELIIYYNNFEDKDYSIEFDVTNSNYIEKDKDYSIEFDVTNSNYIEKDKEAEDMTDVEYDKLYEIVRKFISELNDTKNIFLTSPKHKKRS